MFPSLCPLPPSAKTKTSMYKTFRSKNQYLITTITKTNLYIIHAKLIQYK